MAMERRDNKHKTYYKRKDGSWKIILDQGQNEFSKYLQFRKWNNLISGICFHSELAAVAHSLVNAEGSDPMRCLQPSKEEDQIEINKRNQVYWYRPIIPGTYEAEAGASQVQSLST